MKVVFIWFFYSWLQWTFWMGQRARKVHNEALPVLISEKCNLGTFNIRWGWSVTFMAKPAFPASHHSLSRRPAAGALQTLSLCVLCSLLPRREGSRTMVVVSLEMSPFPRQPCWDAELSRVRTRAAPDTWRKVVIHVKHQGSLADPVTRKGLYCVSQAYFKCVFLKKKKKRYGDNCQ